MSDLFPIPFLLVGLVMMAIAGTQGPTGGRPLIGAAGLVSFAAGIVLFVAG